jgi:pSer/pThr/pTyr-binding forkhead associated (FHA) protein
MERILPRVLRCRQQSGKCFDCPTAKELAMRITLTRPDPVASTEEIRVESFPAVIGRSPDADVVLRDQWASGTHCELDVQEGRPVVRDLDSRNGTLVNGRDVSEAALSAGDILTVGITPLRVSCEPSDEAESRQVRSEPGQCRPECGQRAASIRTPFRE